MGVASGGDDHQRHQRRAEEQRIHARLLHGQQRVQPGAKHTIRKTPSFGINVSFNLALF